MNQIPYKIYHKQNEGLALGRDYAIKYANSKYILPLDADDLIEPTWLVKKFCVLNDIDKEMVKRDIYQGDKVV